MSTSSSGKPRTAAQIRQDNNRDQGGRFGVRTWDESDQSINAERDVLRVVGAELTDKDFEGNEGIVTFDGAQFDDSSVSLENRALSINDSSLDDSVVVALGGGTISGCEAYGSRIVGPDAEYTPRDVGPDVDGSGGLVLRNVTAVESYIGGYTALDGGTYTDCHIDVNGDVKGATITGDWDSEPSCVASLQDCTVTSAWLTCGSVKGGSFRGTLDHTASVEGTKLNATIQRRGRIVNLRSCEGEARVAASSVLVTSCKLDRLSLSEGSSEAKFNSSTVNEFAVGRHHTQGDGGPTLTVLDSALNVDSEVTLIQAERSTFYGREVTGLRAQRAVSNCVFEGDFGKSNFSPVATDTTMSARLAGQFDGSTFAGRRVGRSVFEGSFRGTTWHGTKVVDGVFKGDFDGADFAGAIFADGVDLSRMAATDQPMSYNEHTRFPSGYDPASPENSAKWVRKM